LAGTLIVGGGIAGLSAAWYLARAGIESTIIEKQSEPGGVIRTDRRDDCILEAGPDSFLAAKPEALDLIREAGLEDQLIGSNDDRRVTYILKRGRLVALPDGLMMMVPTKIMPMVKTSLVGWHTKLRMGFEYLRRPGDPQPDRSVHDFLLDHYGEEAVDYLAEPLLAGVYGGDPKQLSAPSVLTRFVEIETKYGSLTRGTLAASNANGQTRGGSIFKTLQGGLGTLVDAVSKGRTILHGTAETLECTAAGYRVRVNGDWLQAESVIVATPAHATAALLRSIDGEMADLLSAIPYNSSVTLALAFRTADLKTPPHGFGFLVPKRERRLLAAGTWVQNKFDHRAPAGIALLRCFLGGDALNESDESLVEIAREEVRRILGITAIPLFHNLNRWQNAMAQYTVGHAKRVQDIEARRRAIPGLSLAGNAYQGIGIPDCVRTGKQAAQAVAVTGLRRQPSY
jgi:oxygen-dependent protoporphyrinogen oxidase